MVEFKGSHREWQQMVYGMSDNFYDKYAPIWANQMRKKQRGNTVRWLRRYLKHPDRHRPKDLLRCSGCPFGDTHEFIYENISSQLSGWCHYLNTGDFMPEGTSILWDGCRECDMNMTAEEEEEYFKEHYSGTYQSIEERYKYKLYPNEIWELNKKGGSKKTKTKRIEKARIKKEGEQNV